MVAELMQVCSYILLPQHVTTFAGSVAHLIMVHKRDYGAQCRLNNKV